MAERLIGEDSANAHRIFKNMEIYSMESIIFVLSFAEVLNNRKDADLDQRISNTSTP